MKLFAGLVVVGTLIASPALAQTSECLWNSLPAATKPQQDRVLAAPTAQERDRLLEADLAPLLEPQLEKLMDGCGVPKGAESLAGKAFGNHLSALWLEHRLQDRWKPEALHAALARLTDQQAAQILDWRMNDLMSQAIAAGAPGTPPGAEYTPKPPPKGSAAAIAQARLYSPLGRAGPATPADELDDYLDARLTQRVMDAAVARATPKS